MESERKTFEKLSAVSDVKMSPQKQREVWGTIEKEIDEMNPVPTKHHRPNLWGTGAAAVAAVLIVVGGLYTSSHHASMLQKTKAGSPTASKNTSTASTSIAFPREDEIQSIVVWGKTPPWEGWHTQAPHDVENQVLGWLKQAVPYKGTVPKLQEHPKQGVTTPYLGSAQLIIKLNNRVISITPAFYEVKGQDGDLQVRYVKNVVAYADTSKNGDRPIYMTSPRLYTWLKNDQWKTEFAPTTLHPVPSYIDPQGHNLTMVSQMVGLATVYVPSQIQGAGNLVTISGDASSKTLSITFAHLGINESIQPLSGGGIVNLKNTVTLANGVKAQWMKVTGHTNTSWVLELETGSVYMSFLSTDSTLTKNQIEEIASNIIPIQP